MIRFVPIEDRRVQQLRFSFGGEPAHISAAQRFFCKVVHLVFQYFENGLLVLHDLPLQHRAVRLRQNNGLAGLAAWGLRFRIKQLFHARQLCQLCFQLAVPPVFGVIIRAIQINDIRMVFELAFGADDKSKRDHRAKGVGLSRSVQHAHPCTSCFYLGSARLFQDRKISPACQFPKSLSFYCQFCWKLSKN